MTVSALSFQSEAGTLKVDLPTLYETRLLMQASSGSGKTHALFDLLQQTYGAIQHLIIDKEGEFGRLRKKYDYLLVGTDGELALDQHKGAVELLLRKVLELQVNTIWDLSDLPPDQQKQYLARLAREAAHLPQRSGLWDQMRLLVVDEIPFFAPQGGKKDHEPALEPLIELVSLSRKRGFCPIGATTRVERLDKNVSELLENRLIGRAGVSSSKRAAELLDFDTKGRRDLITLAKGHFWAYGPALALDPVLVHTRETMAVMPRKRGEIAPPAPTPAGLTKVVSALAGFQHEAEEEARSLDELRAQNADLKKRLKQIERAKTAAATPDPIAVQKQIDGAITRARKAWESDVANDTKEATRIMLAYERNVRGQFTELAKRIGQIGNHLVRAVEITQLQIEPIPPFSPATNGKEKVESAVANLSTRVATTSTARAPAARAEPFTIAEGITAPQQRIIDSLATMETVGVESTARQVVGALAGYSNTDGGSFANYVGNLRSRGLVTYPREGLIQLTEEGRKLANLPDQPLGLEDLHDKWCSIVDAPHEKILRVVIESYPNAIARSELGAKVGYTNTDGGSFANYLGRLRTMGAVDYPEKGMVIATDLLFPEGLR